MPTTTSPNMGLVIPVVSQEPGPAYATDINNSLTTIDAHDHSTGSGVQITPSGLNINSDLSFNSANAIAMRTVRFSAQVSPISSTTADVGCVYVSGVDLYYNDVNGTPVRMTQSGSVAGATGSITGLVAPATATYVTLSTKFVWQSNVNTAADLDARNIILRNSAASSFGLTLQPPAAMGADFAITLPSLPGSQSFVTLDASGTLSAPVVYPLATAGIANGAVTKAKLSGLGQVISSASASTTTTSLTDVVFLQTTPLTISGRPVMIFLQASIAGASSFLKVTTTSVTLSGVYVVSRTLGSGSIAVTLAQYEVGVGGTTDVPLIPSSSVQYMDTVGSGSWVYQLSMRVSNAAGTAELINSRLVAYEL